MTARLARLNTSCDTCGALATVALLDVYVRRVGQYCELCGLVAFEAQRARDGDVGGGITYLYDPPLPACLQPPAPRPALPAHPDGET